MKKSTQLTYITLLLVGTLSATATAQTVEPEPQPSPVQADITDISSSEFLTEVESTPPTEPKTDSLSQEAELPSAPSPETTQIRSPQTLAEFNSVPRTLSEAGFLSPTDSPKTAPPQLDISPETAQTPETETTEDESPVRFRPRIGAQFTTGPGVGYESSFVGIEGFVPLQQTPEQNLTFLEGRLLLSDDTEPGGNLVVGHRVYNSTRNRTLGGYVAYDFRDTGDNDFHQLGAGVETLGESWDARINAYIPIGDNRQLAEEDVFDSNVSLLNQPIFRENSLIIGERQRQVNRRFESALTGLDAEGGVRIAPLGETGELRGYAGLYFYDGPGTDGFLGGRIRAEARFLDIARVGLSLQTDDNFGTTLILSLGANFPGTRPTGIDLQDQVLSRMGESVIRQQNIVVDEQSESFTELEAIALTNPDTEEPYVFRHVNLGVGTGNGTFENPTGTVAEALTVAESSDIVYVQPGTNPGIPAFTIPDEVQVFSTASVQQLESQEAGIVQLPLSGSGVRPLVTGTVTLGDNNTLSGFEISGAVGSGIRGEGIETTTIQNNVIRNSTTASPDNLGNGILLTNATGTITITNNTISDNRNSAIAIESEEGEANLVIGTNAIANNFNGISINFAGSTQATAEITNNSITTSGIGIDTNLTESSQFTNLTISNNIFESPNPQGISFQTFDNAQATTVTISNNTIRNLNIPVITDESQGDGIFFGFNQSSSVQQLTLSGNTINTVAEDGISLLLSDDSVATVTISNNQISNANSQGIFLGNVGIQVDADDNSQLQLVLDSNTITGSADQGISIFAGAGGGSPQVFTSVRLNILTGNNVNGFTTGGFDAQTFNTSTMCLRLSNNTSDTFNLVNNGGTFQAEVGTNTGTATPVGTTAAPPFVGCTVP